MTIGKWKTAAHYLDALLSETYLISDQLLEPTAFGYLDGSTFTGAVFNGTYGANDTYFDYETMGDDKSGGGNDWTNTGVTRSTTVPPFGIRS